ncbi:MAG: hypothetical protein A2622_14080 [Bdellovibrionales bacterium RIFCSPHIGHO2_01_FULL_40_29]|nr:MAG: hypothetical protein A2622_14080 [Bdellovibrionales bacterium RIFCSPHIGHO2_01_FULL_40_29]OFZ33649.1 MAG: hypothetical protein A3D17_11690 [Bdellovibrionales bacterium RIFCSPHIGHO2_02_FULL_40_15]
MDQRLIEIETKIAYQDKLLEELNGVVYQQQIKVDELEKMVKELQKKIGDDINGAHVVPPHY